MVIGRRFRGCGGALGAQPEVREVGRRGLRLAAARTKQGRREIYEAWQKPALVVDLSSWDIEEERGDYLRELYCLTRK